MKIQSTSFTHLQAQAKFQELHALWMAGQIVFTEIFEALFEHLLTQPNQAEFTGDLRLLEFMI